MSNVSENESALLKHIQGLGKFESRLKETSSGDVRFLQWGPPKDLGISEDELLELLDKLKYEGYLSSEGRVHEYDTEEYICEWRITPKAEDLFQSS